MGRVYWAIKKGRRLVKWPSAGRNVTPVPILFTRAWPAIALAIKVGGRAIPVIMKVHHVFDLPVVDRSSSSSSRRA